MITKERIDIVRSRARGFTLIEILIVVAIIAILASVVLVGLGPTQRQGRDSRRIQDLAQVQTALELFYNHCGFYPGGNSDSGADCPSGFGTALTASHDSYETMKTEVTGLKALGLPQLPEDPSGGSYVYQYESGNSGNSYTLAATLEDTGNAVLRTNPTDPLTGLTCGSTTGIYCVSL
jgi:prepilin-type N-terminal cleavage/methylation domain-containing protein